MSQRYLTQVLGDAQNQNHRAFAQAWTSDGINDYVRLNLNGDTALRNTLSLNSPFTISYWIKNGTLLYFERISANSFPGASFSGPISRLYLFVSGGNYFFDQLTEGPNNFRRYFTNLPYVNDRATWYHVAITNTGALANNALRVFVNGRGSTAATYSANGSLPTFNEQPNDYLVFGVAPSSNNWFFFSRQIADFMILNRAISEQEVRLLFNRGTNISSNYLPAYGSSILNSRLLHYSFNTSDYLINTPTGQSSVVDVSGNGRNALVFGQGSNPTLSNF